MTKELHWVHVHPPRTLNYSLKKVSENRDQWFGFWFGLWFASANINSPNNQGSKQTIVLRYQGTKTKCLFENRVARTGLNTFPFKSIY